MRKMMLVAVALAALTAQAQADWKPLISMASDKVCAMTSSDPQTKVTAILGATRYESGKREIQLRLTPDFGVTLPGGKVVVQVDGRTVYTGEGTQLHGQYEDGMLAVDMQPADLVAIMQASGGTASHLMTITLSDGSTSRYETALSAMSAYMAMGSCIKQTL
jgi:hypothetical protein